jgi:hypothetical protein
MEGRKMSDQVPSVLTALGIDPDKFEQELRESFQGSNPKKELLQIRRELARERPSVSAEVDGLQISPSGEVSVRMLFDPVEVSAEPREEVETLAINGFELRDLHQEGHGKISTCRGLRQEFLVSGRPHDQVTRALERSGAITLSGRLQDGRAFTAIRAGSLRS